MPNWCENTIEIFAKDETITWIEKSMNNNIGRRWDDAAMRRQFEFVHGNEAWFSLVIFVRTGYGPPEFIISTLLEKFKDIHIKGHFWIEGGMGAADYEIGTDKDGKKYEIYKEIDQNIDWEEIDYQNFQEFPQDGEDEWDAERIQQPHWYDEDDTLSDIFFYLDMDYYKDDNDPYDDSNDGFYWYRYYRWSEHLYYLALEEEIEEMEEYSKDMPTLQELQWDEKRIQQLHWCEEKEDQEEIDQLLPYELYTDAECYLSVWHGMLDNHDWVTYDTWLEGYYTLEAMEDYDKLERKELEEKEEIPSDEELAFDQCRTDHQAIFATADNECFKIKNVEQYERNERELNSILISDDIANDFLKDLEEQTDMPTEEELNYHVYDLLLEDERADFLYDSDPYQYIGQYYTRDDWEWVTYDQAIHNILFEEKCRLEEDEFWRHEQDYEDYVIYLDETPMYEDEDEIPGWDELEFDELRVDHSSVFERAEELGLKIRNFEDYERYYDEIYEDLWKEEVYRELQEEEEILNDIPTEEELEQDYINGMDFDEWRDYMYKIGKPLRILKKA
jgi:hypothetical protein